MIELSAYGSAQDGVRPLLAIPGIDGSAGSILPIVDRLSAQRRVWVANYAREDNPTLEALTVEIASTVRKQGLGPVDVLGQSLGSIMAAQLAGHQALDIHRVVLVCTFTRLRWAALRMSNAALRVTPEPLFRATAAPLMAWVCGPVGDGQDHPFFAASRASDPDGVHKRTGWEIGRDFASDLSRVRTPTLLLLGEEDRFVPDPKAEAEKLARIFADRPHQLVTVPGAGHVLLPSAAITRASREIERFLA